MAKTKVVEEKFKGQLGDCYSVVPEFSRCRVDKGKAMCGVVVSIPPHRRYAVLAFPGVHGTSREAFWPEDLKARCKRVKEGRA